MPHPDAEGTRPGPPAIGGDRPATSPGEPADRSDGVEHDAVETQSAAGSRIGPRPLRPQPHAALRNAALALVFVLAIALGFSQLAGFESVVVVLGRGDWRWLLLALAVQLMSQLSQGVTLRAVYRALGMQPRLRRLVLLNLGATFLNITTPSAGLGGMALYVLDARRQGLPTARAAIAGVLSVLYDYLAFIAVLALGLIVLFRRADLTAGEIAASAVLVATAFALTGLLILAYRSESRLEQVLVGGVRLVNRVWHFIVRRDLLDVAHARHFGHDSAEGLRALRTNARDLLMPTALALSVKSQMIVILWLTFVAFRQPYSMGTLVAGYAIGQLFLIVSPTPSGIGVVESAMTLGLHGLRVPLESATVITLTYRGLTFWLPWLYGMFGIRLLGDVASVDALIGPG